MGPSPQTSQRGLRKRVIPVHYQKKSSLNQSRHISGKNKLTRCDPSNNNRSLALALQEARIDLARKTDQIINFQHLRAQVELCIPIFEKTLLELKEALQETYNDTRHSAKDETYHELRINKIAEKPLSTDTCKEKLLNLRNKQTFSKSVKVQDIPTNAMCYGDGSISNFRSIETITESPEKVNSLPKMMLSKIPTFNVFSQKSALKRKNTETLVSESDPHKEILKNASSKLRKNNPKVEDLKTIRRETFVIRSADQNDCEIDSQHDSEPETVSEITLNNPSDQGKALNEIENLPIPSNYDKRKTFIVNSVVGETPALHLNMKQNQKSSLVSESLQTNFQEVELGSKAPSSGELKNNLGLKENIPSNDPKETTIVDHANLKKEKCHLPAQQSIESESGVIVTNVISHSAASSVQNTVDTKCFEANPSLQIAQFTVQNCFSEYSTKQKSEEKLLEQRIAEDMQPVNCFLEFQENVDSKRPTKTRRSLRLKGTDVATKKSEYVFPRKCKRKSLMVESAEQMHHRKWYGQIFQDDTMQQQEANISEKNVQMPEIKSPTCLVTALTQNALKNDHHRENIKEASEEIMHSNEKRNRNSSSISKLLLTSFQEVELGSNSPFSVTIKREPGLKEDFTTIDSKERIMVDIPNMSQEKCHLPAKQSTENESGVVVVNNVIPSSAASSMENYVDAKCCKANLPLEKAQSSAQNFLTKDLTKQTSDQLLTEDMQTVDCFLELHENIDSQKQNKTRQSLRVKRTHVATKKSEYFFPSQNKRSSMTEKTEQKNMQMPEKSPTCVEKTLEQNSSQNDNHKGNTKNVSGEKVCDKLKKINEELDALLSKPATITPPFRGQIINKLKRNRYNFSCKMSFARKQTKKYNKKYSINNKKFLPEESTISCERTEVVKNVEVQNTELDNNTLLLRSETSGKAEEMHVHSTVENELLNANQGVASKNYHKTAQTNATKIKHENQEIQSYNNSQNSKNEIGDVKGRLSDDSFVVGNYIDKNEGLPSINPSSLHSPEKNSSLPREKMALKEKRKTKVKIPKRNIKNDPLDYLMQVPTVKTEHQEESMETQASHKNHTVTCKNIQLDCEEDIPNEKRNKHPISPQISLQHVVCLVPEVSKIQVDDTFSNEKHNLMSNLNHPMTQKNSSKLKKIKEKNHRSTSVVNASKSKNVGNELKFKNVRKSPRGSSKAVVHALKDLNEPKKFEVLIETTETSVQNDDLISKNLKLSKAVKDVSNVDREIKCESEKVCSVSNRINVEQSTVVPQSQNDNKNHRTPGQGMKQNSFIVNKSLSPCVVHLVEEIVECDVDPKQCNEKDCMPVKKKRVKPKKGKKRSNILKENVKPQSTKTLGKGEILTVADIHEPPRETPNCEKNVLTDMQPSVVLNDILGQSKFSKVKNGPSTDGNIATSHEVPVSLNEKNSEMKILPEATEPSGIISRRTRKPVNYKEPSVTKKLRR